MRLPAALVLAALSGAQALASTQQVETLWNCRDKDGRTILTNQQSDTVGRECRIVHQQRITVVPPPKAGAKAPSPAGFPKESALERAASRDRQRQTLERELAQEQDMLAEARRRLAEQESARSGEERARALERLKPYQDAVEVHHRNVEALKRELANLNR